MIKKCLWLLSFLHSSVIFRIVGISADMSRLFAKLLLLFVLAHCWKFNVLVVDLNRVVVVFVLDGVIGIRWHAGVMGMRWHCSFR